METIKVDVRIIACHELDLRKMMEEDRFREDLFYASLRFQIQLAAFFSRRKRAFRCTPALPQQIRRGEPQNLGSTDAGLSICLSGVRLGRQTSASLENVIERAVVLTPGIQTIDIG